MLSPLLASNTPVDWWFAFKFNDATYQGNPANETNPGIFGGTPDRYKEGFSLAYAVASSATPSLTMGNGSLGTSLTDPLGATFNQIYNGQYNYVLWNDQFYNDPIETKDSPWGHSKGALAWDANGEGFVLQVSTPSWPASGSATHPRNTDGNTLGCIKDDDVLVSQHFFALKLNKDDVTSVLQALGNASVVTAVDNPQIFSVDGGPADLAALARQLGKEEPSGDDIVNIVTLSSGVRLISKASGAHYPPWQMVSSLLGNVPLRVASWWSNPEIPSSDKNTPISCWPVGKGLPGAVEIAQTGSWQGKSIGFLGEAKPTGNHTKVGVSTDVAQPLCIFGDMNQQGTLDGQEDKAGCASSQNGRGGTFYVLDNPVLFSSLTQLLAGN